MSLDLWRAYGLKEGWKMPSAPRWKRLPGIRWVRALVECIRVEAWYRHGPGRMGVRTGYDDWVVYGIARGQERPRSGAEKPG